MPRPGCRLGRDISRYRCLSPQPRSTPAAFASQWPYPDNHRVPWEESWRSTELLLGAGDRVDFVPGVGGQREAPVIKIIVNMIIGFRLIIIRGIFPPTWRYKGDLWHPLLGPDRLRSLFQVCLGCSPIPLIRIIIMTTHSTHDTGHLLIIW